MKNTTYIVVPRYAELGMNKLKFYVKELGDLAAYFPGIHQNELPERDYLWTIISTLMLEATHNLLTEAREHRSVKSKEDTNQLIKIDSELYTKPRDLVTQRRK